MRGAREQCHEGGCGHQHSLCRRVGLKHCHGALGTSPLSLHRGEAEPGRFCPTTPRHRSASRGTSPPSAPLRGVHEAGAGWGCSQGCGGATLPPGTATPKQGAEGHWGPAGAGGLDACPPRYQPSRRGSQRCPTAAGLGTCGSGDRRGPAVPACGGLGGPAIPPLAQGDKTSLQTRAEVERSGLGTSFALSFPCSSAGCALP